MERGCFRFDGTHMIGCCIVGHLNCSRYTSVGMDVSGQPSRNRLRSDRPATALGPWLVHSRVNDVGQPSAIGVMATHRASNEKFQTSRQAAEAAYRVGGDGATRCWKILAMDALWACIPLQRSHGAFSQRLDAAAPQLPGPEPQSRAPPEIAMCGRRWSFFHSGDDLRHAAFWRTVAMAPGRGRFSDVPL